MTTLDHLLPPHGLLQEMFDRFSGCSQDSGQFFRTRCDMCELFKTRTRQDLLVKYLSVNVSVVDDDHRRSSDDAHRHVSYPIDDDVPSMYISIFLYSMFELLNEQNVDEDHDDLPPSESSSSVVFISALEDLSRFADIIPDYIKQIISSNIPPIGGQFSLFPHGWINRVLVSRRARLNRLRLTAELQQLDELISSKFPATTAVIANVQQQ